MKIRLLGRARKRISSNPGCANHSDEPLKAKIMSAEASIIFEFHLHCTKIELERLFFQSGRSTVLIKTAENCAKGIKLAIIKGGEIDAGLCVLADFKGGLEIRVSGQEELKMVQ